MKKEYVITEVSMSQDGSPYVLVSMVESKDLGGAIQQQPSSPQFRTGVTVLGPTSPNADNIAREIQKALSGALGGAGRLGPHVTVIRLDIREYQESGIRVGDKVAIEITTRSTKEEV